MMLLAARELPIAFALSGIAGLVLILLIALCFYAYARLNAKRREYQHLERMKALELGRDPDCLHPKPPAPPPEHVGRFWIAFWLGAVAPVGMFMVVAKMGASGQPVNFGVQLTAWIGVTVAALASVVCSCIILLARKRCE